MKLVAVDLETTGLDPEKDQILEIGAIIYDLERPLTQLTEMPTFHCYLLHKVYRGHPIALSMNAAILKRIGELTQGYHYFNPEEAVSKFRQFLQANGLGLPNEPSPTAVGKNFGSFDMQFLNRITDQYGEKIKWAHRSLDVGSMFFNPTTAKGNKLPSLDDCLKLAKIEKTVQHNALDDCRDVIRCVCYKYFRS